MVTVAVDATPLLGRVTGIGVVVGGLLAGLRRFDDLDLVGFGVTGRGWRDLPGVLPDGVRPSRGPLPAAVAHRLWLRGGHPDLRWWTGPADVVHGMNYVVPPARGAARLVSVHDLTALRFPHLCSPAALRYPDLVRRAIAGGAAVHTGAHSVAVEIEEHFGVPAADVHVVGWGIDPVDPGAGPAPRPAGTGRPYILGLGTVEPRKDFPLLVAAFDRIAADHPDLDLVIAGPEGWGEAALTAAVAASPVAGRIRRLGWVADRAALLAGATVFAYPSVYEGFGLPPLEAMAAGVPVVATAAGAVPEVVGDAADLVAPGDADALAAALARAVDDDAHRAVLVVAGTARVATFTWERTAAAMRDVYLGLAAARR